MKKIKFLFCFLMISGCSHFQPLENSFSEPKLLKQSPLPPVKQNFSRPEFDFYCEMLINENGDVERVKMLKSSGDKEWDSLAAISLYSWKFSPALKNGNPVSLSIRRKFVVVFENPKYMMLAEIQLKNLQIADSVYKALTEGADFSSLAVLFSSSPSKERKGLLGRVDIRNYSREIYKVLADLDEDEFTKPLKYGEQYIIFKRMKDIAL